MAIDIRLKQLSYSSLLTAHKCPRKFQLDRLQADKQDDDTNKSSVTFAFGHVVGEGIQLVFQNLTEEEIIWRMFLMWDVDLFDDNPKQAKSFWEAIQAIQKFISMRESGFLSDWELAYHDGKPCCELSFLIHLPDGFKYRGFVDAVLVNKDTGEIKVLEVKTTGQSSVNAATYKNSAQAIGYSVVLDHLFPGLSSYEVLYLVYKTKQREYDPLPFTKSYLQRALWIRELLLDIEVLKMYEQADIYPMRGESCFDFYRECEYLYTCTLSTDKLTDPLLAEEVEAIEAKHKDYQIHITLNDLIIAQLNKEESE